MTSSARRSPTEGASPILEHLGVGGVDEGEAVGEEGEEDLVAPGDSTRRHPLSFHVHHLRHFTTQVS